MRHFISILLPFWLLFAACEQAPQTLTDAQRAGIESAITGIVDELISASEVINIDKVEALIEKEALMGNNGRLYNSREEMLNVFRPGWERLSGQKINLSHSKVTLLAPHLAIMSGEGFFTATDTTGYTTPERPYVWTMVFRKNNGEWKIAHL